MCRIERYNLIFPDGHVELRERVVNTCRRGTPGAPCHRREYTQLNRDRFATQADIEEHARNNALVITPSPYLTQNPDSLNRPEESTLRRRKDHRGVLGGLALEFKLWNPFSSGSKRDRKASNGRSSSAEPAIIERMPEAPMPPPAWVPREGPRPKIVTVEPGRKTKNKGSSERKTKTTKKGGNQKRTKKIVIHQIERTSTSDSGSSSDSTEDEMDSPSTREPVRIHRRPKAERSPSPAARAAEAAREARYQKERLARELRSAEAERAAREHAQREHEDELRRERRRIRHPERRPLESEPIRRDRQQREDRAEEERLRQEREDREALRFQQEQQQARDRAILRQPRGGRGVTLHHHQHRRGNSIEETGQDFLDGAVAEARRRREEGEASDATRDGGWGGAAGLQRRNTTDGTRRRSSSRDRRGRGHDRWRRYGGSG